MSAFRSEKPTALSVAKRQLAVCAAFALLLAVLLAGLYLQDRRRVWTLRREQVEHRRDAAFELISRELDRVRADALFLADQQSSGRFRQGGERDVAAIEAEFASFIRRKETYDQIRLLDLAGREVVRVNYSDDDAVAVEPSKLQDKSDRYYFREALTLSPGEVFVSDFDLNLEHGQVEKPLKPVIRFVAPIADEQQTDNDKPGAAGGLLVLNYLGARLLGELDNSTLPGITMLLRSDGNYLRSRDPRDQWGWLLGHDRTFAAGFPDEWSRSNELLNDCQLTPNGAFAARRISLGRRSNEPSSPVPPGQRDSIIVVAHLSREQVFDASNELLGRLLLLAGCVFVPLAVFARYWAQATLTRELQARQLAKSEERLRALSSKLLRIQEDERRAISREIHDELGQQVTAINLDLKLADRTSNAEAARPHLQRAIRENEGLLQTLHAFATRVRPAVLDDLGLRDAVESHISEFQQRNDLEVLTELEFDSNSIPHDVADNAYRLLQESLNNVAKHADATQVRVDIAVATENSRPYLCMTIRDNGRGYQPQETHGRRLGLVGMQERVDLLGGELSIESDVDQGASVEIRLPLHELELDDRLSAAAEALE